MGLESWCVKHIFTYIHNTIISLRKSKSKIHDTNRLERLLLGGVILNPDINTFWNIRRELVLENNIDIKNELHISKIVLSHKPKSNETFIYREWILQRMIKMQLIQVDEQLHNLIQQELSIASKAIDKCSNNYHATNYKLYIMRNLAPLIPLYFEIILQNELSRSEINMSTAVSDSSIFYYRQQIINILKDVPIQLDEKYLNKLQILLKQNVSCKDIDRASVNDMIITLLGKPPSTKLNNFRITCLSNVLKVLTSELVFISELNRMFPCHESIWYHRRFVLWELMLILYNFYDKNIISKKFMFHEEQRISNTSMNITQQSLTNFEQCDTFLDCIVLYKMIVNNEKNELECCDYEQNKFVDRHRKWLILNFNLVV